MATEQRRFLQAGCNACVSKPVDFKLLAEQLAWWLDPVNRLSDQPVAGGSSHDRSPDQLKVCRRSPRIVARIPLRIQSGGGSLEVFTAVINLHGALIISTVNWPAGTLLTATNFETRLTVHARVVWSATQESSDVHKLGVEFEVASPEFWGEQYDPDDEGFREAPFLQNPEPR
jgi:hypothetical protein